MPIVTEQYTFVIGVDTHAATHSLALISASTGALVDQSVFPNTPSPHIPSQQPLDTI
jgi:transposase